MARKPTIYDALEKKLGRRPTDAEVKHEVRRIIGEGWEAGRMKRRRRMKTNLGEPTKQDFVAVTKIFCRHNVPEAAARDLASYFAQQNPRFQTERFIAATKKC